MVAGRLPGDCRQTIISHVLYIMTRSVLCLILFSLISMASPAGDFETGTVAASDAEQPLHERISCHRSDLERPAGDSV